MPYIRKSYLLTPIGARLSTFGDCNHVHRVRLGNLKHFEKKIIKKDWFVDDLRHSKDASIENFWDRKKSKISYFYHFFEISKKWKKCENFDFFLENSKIGKFSTPKISIFFDPKKFRFSDFQKFQKCFPILFINGFYFSKKYIFLKSSNSND